MEFWISIWVARRRGRREKMAAIRGGSCRFRVSSAAL